MRFEREPHVGKMQQEFQTDIALEMPCKDVPVEEVPLMTGRHPRADPGTGNNEAFRRERFHGFAQDRSRNPEARSKLKVARKDGPDGKLPCDDFPAELADDLCVACPGGFALYDRLKHGVSQWMHPPPEIRPSPSRRIGVFTKE